MKKLVWLLCFVAPTALAQVTIEAPWARASAPASKIAGGYMVIRNKGATADRLVGASSPAAERVETHLHLIENDVMKMRKVAGYDVPAKSRFELKPGGAHLMFMNIKRPFREGDRIPVTLEFAKAGKVKAEFSVGRIGGMGAGGGITPGAHGHGMKR